MNRTFYNKFEFVLLFYNSAAIAIDFLSILKCDNYLLGTVVSVLFTNTHSI